VLSSYISAPKSISWDIVSAHKIRLEGTPPIELDTEADPARPGVFTGVCRYNGRTLPFAYRILEERDGEAMTLQLLLDECDPVYHLGEDHFSAVTVVGDDERSVITHSCELTHTRFLTRLILPL